MPGGIFFVVKIPVPPPYAPPEGDAVDFDLGDSYAPPDGDSIDFDLEDTF